MPNGNNFHIDSDDIKQVLQAIKADKETRKSFLDMQREDQLLSILGMMGYLLNQLAIYGKDIDDFKKEVRGRARKREDIERQIGKKLKINLATAEADDDPDTNITQKVKAIINAQYGGIISFFVDLFKDVAKLIITGMILYLLVATLGGKPPILFP